MSWFGSCIWECLLKTDECGWSQFIWFFFLGLPLKMDNGVKLFGGENWEDFYGRRRKAMKNTERKYNFDKINLVRVPHSFCWDFSLYIIYFGWVVNFLFSICTYGEVNTQVYIKSKFKYKKIYWKKETHLWLKKLIQKKEKKKDSIFF